MPEQVKPAIENGKEPKESKKLFRQQSPIDIIPEHVVYDGTLKSSKLKINYLIGDAHQLEIRNNGFCVWMKNNAKSSISGTHLPANCEYKLAQFHVHWGVDKRSGSEHYLNGKALSGEIHCVYWNTAYGTPENAYRRHDGISVLGIFIHESSGDNLAFEPIVDAIRSAKRSHDKKSFVDHNFDLNLLMPEKCSFYTYPGSLTTTPHDECVIWTILRKHIHVGRSQMDILRSIVPCNVRNVQPLEGRQIRASFKLLPKQSS
ncbi:Carbonic anhydrase [Aphelenchoides bicaudatus]|nr:Carbonic anhydrase [Aphelenchoides bicaudatus]